MTNALHRNAEGLTMEATLDLTRLIFTRHEYNPAFIAH